MSINPPIEMSTAFMIGNFFFHTSWDWLMPVYQKIVKEELYGESEEGIILFNCLSDSLIDGDDIIEVFEHIVEFIKWYNTQSKIKLIMEETLITFPTAKLTKEESNEY